jgi:lipopolysaccharide export system ATP-binding protein
VSQERAGFDEGNDAGDLLDRTGHLDLSALLTLRVLLAEPNSESWVPTRTLMHDLSREFERLESAPTSAIPATAPPWEGTGPRLDEEEEYFEQHALRMLLEERMIEERTLAPGEPSGHWVRLAAPLRDHRPILRERVERRLAPVADAPRAVSTPRTPQEPIDTDDLIEQGETFDQHEADMARVPRERGSTLAAEGLVKVYRKRRVVNDVALHVSQGEIVGLLGPNGAGKTTTFYMMVGLIPPDRGRVTIGAEDVTDTPMFRRARKGIGYLAQEPSIFRKLTVEENVLAILQMLKLSRREREERLELLLDELGIKHLRHSKAYALSGGERRRLEITRALVGRPKFMLLDEPFAGVDPIAVHDIQQIVADLRERNIGVLISDHNVEQTLDIVDRAYIMYEGRVRVSGTVSELVWNDEVAEIYLGPTLTARMRQRYTFPA